MMGRTRFGHLKVEAEIPGGALFSLSRLPNISHDMTTNQFLRSGVLAWFGICDGDELES